MDVNYIIETIGITRKNFLSLIESCDLDKLNKIPSGFSNNLIWNFGHIVASQQALCYERSGLPPRIPTDLIDAYRPTTYPEKFVDSARLEVIKRAAAETTDFLRKDYRAGIFKTYEERQTRYGVLLTNIDEAISYISSHEALHLGYAKALLRVL